MLMVFISDKSPLFKPYVTRFSLRHLPRVLQVSWPPSKVNQLSQYQGSFISYFRFVKVVLTCEVQKLIVKVMNSKRFGRNT